MNKPHQNHSNRCPVCYMDVDPEVGIIDHQSMSFGFCSQQCFDRFKSKPGLYIGKQGVPAPKQRGECSIKRRMMKLGSSLSEIEKQQLTDSLTEMMGIRKVQFEETTISIEYDLMEATYEQIEAALVQCGAKLGGGWSSRLKYAFINFIEETELDALEGNQSSHGCHHH